MPEQVQDVVDEPKQEPTVDENSSMEDILAEAQKQEEAPAEQEGSSSSEEANQEETAEVVKTDEPGDEGEQDEEVEEGKPIPYQRFAKENKKKKQYQRELEETRKILEEREALLKDPDVLLLALKKRGFTDEAAREHLIKQGIEVPEKEEAPEDVGEITTQEELKAYVEQIAKNALKPVEQKVTQVELQRRKEEAERRYISDMGEAAKLSKEVYGLEFGAFTQRDGGRVVKVGTEDDLNTAVGNIAAYLRENPEDARLGVPKLLKLAMAGKGLEIVKKKAAEEEKKRQRKVSTAAMEDGGTPMPDEIPNASWDTQDIIAFKRKYPNFEL